MKKVLLSLLTTASLLATSLVSAATVDLSGYYSALHPKATVASKALLLPPTNITVTNYSEDLIFVAVPGAIDDAVPSGKSDTISHDSYSGSTHLVLQYINRYGVRATFFDQYVCQRAMLTVDGRDGFYHSDIDARYCY